MTGNIPLLTRLYTNGKKLLHKEEIQKSALPDKGNYFIGKKPLKDILKSLPKENVIYTFSQRHKITIAKSLLHEA